MERFRECGPEKHRGETCGKVEIEIGQREEGLQGVEGDGVRDPLPLVVAYGSEQKATGEEETPEGGEEGVVGGERGKGFRTGEGEGGGEVGRGGVGGVGSVDDVGQGGEETVEGVRGEFHGGKVEKICWFVVGVWSECLFLRFYGFHEAMNRVVRNIAVIIIFVIIIIIISKNQIINIINNPPTAKSHPL